MYCGNYNVFLYIGSIITGLIKWASKCHARSTGPDLYNVQHADVIAVR